MSWLQDALGKAEDMLNNLDQQASQVFENDDNESQKSFSKNEKSSKNITPKISLPNDSNSMSTSLNFPLIGKNSSYSGPNSPLKSLPQKSRSEVGESSIPRASTPNLEIPRSHSPGSIAGSDREMTSMKIAPSMESISSLSKQVWSNKINKHQRTNSDLVKNSEERNASNDSNNSSRSNTLASASAVITMPTTSTDVNSLQLENTLLRQEIASLNSEIAMLSDRCEYTKTQLNAKISQSTEQAEALGSYQKQVEALHEDNSELDNYF